MNIELIVDGLFITLLCVTGNIILTLSDKSCFTQNISNFALKGMVSTACAFHVGVFLQAIVLVPLSMQAVTLMMVLGFIMMFYFAVFLYGISVELRDRTLVPMQDYPVTASGMIMVSILPLIIGTFLFKKFLTNL